MVLATICEIEKREINIESLPELKIKILKVLEDRTAQEKEYEESKNYNFSIPRNLPKEIKYASYIVYFTVMLEVVEIYWLKTEFNFSFSLGAASIKFPSYLLLILWGYLIHIGHNWTRYLFLSIKLIGIVFSIFAFKTLFSSPIYIIQNLLQFIAIYLLFSSKANKWYKEETREFKNTATNKPS